MTANIHSATKTLLGGLMPREFMADHWQKKWKLINQAIPAFDALVSVDELWKLACSPEVESRLVLRQGKKVVLEHGPFTQARLNKLPKRDWTLLIQGLNLHVPAADALLRRFSFLPYARLDDVMVSLAAPGGGVGPHFDSYDVFLLQGVGKRRWQISEQTDLSLVPDAPLKILKRMMPSETFELTAGDMLYLPPHVAHDGVAMPTESMVDGESAGYCTTYSIGFRAPTHQDLADGFLDWISATSEIEGRLADPDLTATEHPARIPKQYQREVANAIAKLQMDKAAIKQFAGCYATDPKPSIEFAPPKPLLSRTAFAKACSAANGGAVALAAGTLCLYDDEFLFINGDAFVVQGDAPLWHALADARTLSVPVEANSETLDALYEWYRDGWLRIARA